MIFNMAVVGHLELYRKRKYILPSDRFCDVALYTRSKSDANILFLG